MRDLLEGNELPQDIKFYTALLKSSFDYIEDDRKRIEALNNEYITF